MRKAIMIALLLAVPAMAGQYEDGYAALQSGDYTTALRLFTPLAERGEADAQFNLGLMYLGGSGVPQSYETAAKWFRKSAEQGDAGAQFNLGTMYLHGDGVQQSEVQAVRWYLKAADRGHPIAQFNVATLYVQGHTLPQDYIEAYKWYTIAITDCEIASNTRWNREIVASKMTVEEIAEARRLADQWKQNFSYPQINRPRCE